MNVVPIAREWIEVYPATVGGQATWVMELAGDNSRFGEHPYAEFHPSRDQAITAAGHWDRPIRFTD